MSKSTMYDSATQVQAFCKLASCKRSVSKLVIGHHSISLVAAFCFIIINIFLFFGFSYIKPQKKRFQTIYTRYKEKNKPRYIEPRIDTPGPLLGFNKKSQAWQAFQAKQGEIPPKRNRTSFKPKNS